MSELGKFIRFALVGASVLALENLIVHLGDALSFKYAYVRLFSACLSVAVSYVLNSAFTFRRTLSWGRFASFVLGAALGALTSLLVSVIFYYLVFDSSAPLLATNLGALVAVAVNFGYQRFVTFGAARMS